MLKSRTLFKKALQLLPLLGLLPLPVSAHDAGAGPVGQFFTSFPLEAYIVLALAAAAAWYFRFAGRRRSASSLAVLAIVAALSIWTFQQTGSAIAAISSMTPNGGECIKGGDGATYNIQWTQNDGPEYDNHGFLSYSTQSGTPGSYATFNPPPGPNQIAHPASNPYVWTTPSITNGTMRIYVEPHNSNHSFLSTRLSAADFSLDADLPSAPTLSSTGKTSTSVTLSWTASSDPGCMGLTGYKILRNGAEIASVGAVTTYEDTNLSASTQYSYVVKAYDSFGSADSNGLSVTTNPDTTPPAMITTLAASAPTTSALTLTWTAPGDDNGTGTAASYDIRYSTSTIDSTNFTNATPVSGEPAPQVAGTQQTMVVPGLTPSTTYFFAMKTSDEVPNVSAMSNVSSGTTTASSGGGGGTAPVTVTLSTPNGGETLTAGTMYQIFWGSGGSGTQSIRLSLSTDSGATYPTVIASEEVNDGLYDWTVPAMATTAARVKVEALGASSAQLASDASNADFTITVPPGTTPAPPPPPPAPPPPPPPPPPSADGTYDPVPLTQAEQDAPTTDPNSTGAYSPSGTIAATPTIDVDKGLVPPPPEVKLPCIGGTLIKLVSDNDPLTTHDTTVYYCGKNGKRYYFPNQSIFFTWYANFKSVLTLDAAAMAKVPLGGNITYKPGVKMVKITTDPKVYAIARAGLLRWVKDETVAAGLYGSRWNRNIDDVPDSFFVNYQIGDPIETP